MKLITAYIPTNEPSDFYINRDINKKVKLAEGYFHTPEEMDKLLSDVWDAAQDRYSWETVPYNDRKEPLDKEQYLTQLKGESL